MDSLWLSSSHTEWQRTLRRYGEVVASQGVARLPELDHFSRAELPALIHARPRPHVTLTELVRLTEWKMARGVWRAPNLILVRGNAPDVVIATSTAALAGIPHTTWPIATLTQLEGVGPATASAVVAAAAPERYPFFDELVAAQVPQLGKIAWTMGYYARYADAIRSRAVALGEGWTPVMVERALWAHVGGKAGARP